MEDRDLINITNRSSGSCYPIYSKDAMTMYMYLLCLLGLRTTKRNFDVLTNIDPEGKDRNWRSASAPPDSRLAFEIENEGGIEKPDSCSRGAHQGAIGEGHTKTFTRYDYSMAWRLLNGVCLVHLLSILIKSLDIVPLLLSVPWC